MARTKKDQTVETPADELLAGQPAAGADLPQTEMESGGTPGDTALPDLELAAAASLDPDRSQTDLEADEGGEPDQADLVEGSQTDLKAAGNSEDGADPL